MKTCIAISLALTFLSNSVGQSTQAYRTRDLRAETHAIAFKDRALVLPHTMWAGTRTLSLSAVLFVTSVVAQNHRVSIDELTRPMALEEVRLEIGRVSQELKSIDLTRAEANQRYRVSEGASLVFQGNQRLDIAKTYDRLNEQERKTLERLDSLFARFEDWAAIVNWKSFKKLHKSIQREIKKHLKANKMGKTKSPPNPEPNGVSIIMSPALAGLGERPDPKKRALVIDDLIDLAKLSLPLLFWISEEWFFRGKMMGSWGMSSVDVGLMFIAFHLPLNVRDAYHQYTKGYDLQDPFLDPVWAKWFGLNVAMRTATLVVGTALLHALFAWTQDWRLTAILHLFLNAGMYTLQNINPWLWPEVYLSTYLSSINTNPVRLLSAS